ncbi:MAG: zinc/manganese transport system substrate-binding protein [Bacteriovoracaceae bacterium]|jgi:zinc/manganese transport system substrate-binding protein
MKKILLLLVTLNTTISFGSIQVKTTLPELNWLATEIGGELVKSSSLLSGHEDPHFVDVTPAFIFKIKSIDILIKNGLALESTWLPKIIELSGNQKLLSLGLCDASTNLDTLGELEKTDRSMGDVHPEGNPHYTYSPKQMILASRAIANCFQKYDPSNLAIYESNFSKIKDQLTLLVNSVESRLSSFKQINIMTYHEEFKYFCHDFNLSCINTLEDTPGILPSASNMVKKTLFVKEKKVKFVLATDSNPKRILSKFSELSGIKYAQVEAHMNTRIKSYSDFVLQIVRVIEKHGK